MFAAAANIINLRSWHDETGLGDPEHPLLATLGPDYGFRYLTMQQHDQTIQEHLRVTAA